MTCLRSAGAINTQSSIKKCNTTCKYELKNGRNCIPITNSKNGCNCCCNLINIHTYIYKPPNEKGKNKWRKLELIDQTKRMSSKLDISFQIISEKVKRHV